MRNRLAALRSAQWLQIIVSAVAFVLGLLARPMLETAIQPFFSLANLPLLIFVIASTLFAVIIAIWVSIQQQIASINDHTNTLAGAVGQSFKVLEHYQGYEEVRKRTELARTEILKLIYYEVDAKDGKPVYDSKLLESQVRKATYERERLTLEQRHKKAKGTFRYVEIVQIPYGFGVDNVLPYDPIYKESYAFLANFGRTEPNFACLRTSDVVFPETFIMIDNSFLYIAFGVKNPDTGRAQYPFLGLVVEDTNSEVFQSMRTLFLRIEANSKLVTA
jgi:hypothetical protein